MPLKLDIGDRIVEWRKFENKRLGGAIVLIKGLTLGEWRHLSKKLAVPVDDLMLMDGKELSRRMVAKLDEVALLRRREHHHSPISRSLADPVVAKPTST